MRISDDLSPDLLRTIFSMHSRKVEMHPEWARGVANVVDAGQPRT